MLQVKAAHLEALRVLSTSEDRGSTAPAMGQRSKVKPGTHLQQQPRFLVPDLRLHLFVQITDLTVVRRGLSVKKQLGSTGAGRPPRRGLAKRNLSLAEFPTCILTTVKKLFALSVMGKKTRIPRPD